MGLLTSSALTPRPLRASCGFPGVHFVSFRTEANAPSPPRNKIVGKNASSKQHTNRSPTAQTNLAFRHSTRGHAGEFVSVVLGARRYRAGGRPSYGYCELSR